MKRNHKFLFIALLAGVFALGTAACSDDSTAAGECGDNECNGSETCENCPEDCGQCDPCNHDGICDPGESCSACQVNGGIHADCCTVCDLPNMGGPDYDFLISEMFLPTTSAEAAANGVDIDGDGDIDNALGTIISLLSTYMEDDLNDSLNQEIAEGSLLLAMRIRENAPVDGDVAVQILQADLFAPDATPVFEGDDDVTIAADTPQDLFLCGQWDGGPDLETDPSFVTIAFPLPDVGLLEVTLSKAQIRTVTDPDNPSYSTSAVDAAGMTDVMIGGGLSQDEIYGTGGLIEFLGDFLQGMIDEGGSTADTIVDIFDGGCLANPDIPGCADVVAGEGECDDTADPPVITITELKCNTLLSSVLKPDVDTDGDGVDDLLSLGLRVAAAVPVTLHFE